MSDYIKREDAIKALHDEPVRCVKAICDVPSADVVEVVRCKDCKYAEIHKEHNVIFCEINELSGRWIKADDYCSYGEREDGESE